MNALNLCRLRFFATDVDDIDVDRYEELDWAKWLSPLKMATPNPEALRKLFICGSFQSFRTLAVDYGPSQDGLAHEDSVFRDMGDAFFVEPATMQSPEFFKECGMPAFDILARKTQTPESIVRAETRSSTSGNSPSPTTPSTTLTSQSPTGSTGDTAAATAASYGLVPYKPRTPIVPKVRKKSSSKSLPLNIVKESPEVDPDDNVDQALHKICPTTYGSLPGLSEPSRPLLPANKSSSRSACLGPISDSDVDASSSTES